MLQALGHVRHDQVVARELIGDLDPVQRGRHGDRGSKAKRYRN